VPKVIRTPALDGQARCVKCWHKTSKHRQERNDD